MKHLLIYFFIFFVSNSSAQVPGYMGKRFSVMYSNYFMPALEGPTAKKEGKGLNLNHVLGVEYLVAPSKALGLSAQYTRTGFSYRDIATWDYTGPQGIPAVINDISYAFSYKKYGKTRIAPLGVYMKIEVLFSQFTVKYNEDDFYSRDYYNGYGPYYSQTKMDAGSGTLKFNGFGGACSFGKQRVFFNKLLVDFGVRSAMMLPVPKVFDTNVENQIYSATNWRILSHQLINMKIGIGFLAF